MIVVGLTGGIATGKSTVAAKLRALGAGTVDADDIAHEVILQGGPAYDDVVAAFGRAILGSDGQIDRVALGNIVFGDEEKRRQLNQLTHPHISARIAVLIQEERDKDTSVFVVDAALLVESGGADTFRPLIVVTADRETQISRLAARDGISRGEALRKIGSQMPVEEKAKRADFVIDNSGRLESTYHQIERVWETIRARHV